MNFRSTALLFGLLVGMLWLFGFMLAYKKTTFEASAVMPSLLAAQDAEADQIVLQRLGKDGKEFTFTKVNDHWFLGADSSKVKLEDFRINDIVKEVKNARRNEEADVSDDPARFGLEAPQAIVSIKGHVGPKKDREQTWKLKLGKESADKSLVFVSSSDRPNKVFAVNKSTLASLFFTDVNHLRSRQLFEFNDIAVKKLHIKEGKNSLEIAKSDDTWQIVQPPLGLADYEGAAPPAPKEQPPGAKVEPTGGVKSLITTLRGMRVESEEDFVPASETNPAGFGLKEGEERLRIQITTDDKKEETLFIGAKTPGKDEQYYARLAGDPGMFKLTGKQLEPIRKALEDPGQFRARDVTPLDTKKVEQVKITVGKEVVQLTLADGAWQVQTDAGKSVKASDKAVQAFLETIQGKRDIQKFLEASDPEAKKLDAEPAAEIALFDKKDDKKGEAKKDEKKDAKPTVTLVFGKVEHDAVPVKRTMADGTITRFTVARALAEKLLPGSGALAFLDTALPVLPVDDVVSMTVTRGKEKTEIVRGTGDKSQRWLFQDAVGSQDRAFADTTKVETILKKLGNLEAKRWLQKIDAKDDLAKVGLKDPAVEVTFIVKRSTVTQGTLLGVLASPSGAPLLAAFTAIGFPQVYGGEKVTLQLGKETDQDKDRPGTFAKHSGSDLLFLVPPDVPFLLKNLDLRDRGMLLAFQPMLGAAAIAAGPPGLLAATPLLSGQVQSIDPATVKELKLDIRTPAELRKFHFVRDKDKSWTDQSGLIEFNLDPAKVTSLIEQLGKLTADRIVSLGGPRNEFKFGPRDANLKIDFLLDTGRTVTLTVGDNFEATGYFAHSTDTPAAVFVVGRPKVEPYLRGPLYFAKERQVAAE